MEKVITCPVCFNTDQCFEEVQETFSSYLCFKCGFMSDSRYKIGSIKLTENLKKSPKLVRESKFEDKGRGIVWFPSVINMGEKGIIYPDGKINDWHWHYAKVVDVPEEDREKYGGMKKRLDIENPQKYGQFEFMDACKAMGIIVEDGDELDGVAI